MIIAICTPLAQGDGEVRREKGEGRREKEKEEQRESSSRALRGVYPECSERLRVSG